MWKVGNIAPVSVLGVDSAYGFNITTERGQPLVFFAYATQAAAEAAAHGVAAEKAFESGMREKSMEFVSSGAEIYRKI